MATGARSPAFVCHLDQDPASAVGQAHGRRRAGGVPDRVGEAFLHDAVAGKLSRVGQRACLAVDNELGAQSALRRPLDQAGHVVQPRLLAGLNIRLAVSAIDIGSVGPPQAPDQGIELVEAVASTLLYRRYSG